MKNLISVGLLLFSFIAQAQDKALTSCDIDEVMEQLFERNPNSKIAALELEKFIQKYGKQRNSVQTQGMAKQESMVILVVFHVFGKDFQGADVTYEDIVSSLEEVNKDFKIYTSKKLQNIIEVHVQESRKEWLLWIMKYAGEKKRINKVR